MRDPVDRLIRAVSRRNSFALIWVQFGGAHIVLLLAILLFRLFQTMTPGQFAREIAVSQALVALDNAWSIRFVRRLWTPVRRWERGGQGPAATIAAWTTLATLPIVFFRRTWRYPLLLGYVPFMIFTADLLHLKLIGFLIATVVGTSVLACGVVVRYFTMEIVIRPVLERVAARLPEDFEPPVSGLSLRWRLFLAVPVINVVTVLVVAGLATEGHQRTLANLAVYFLLAVGVSLTLSLELLILVVRTLGNSMNDFRSALERLQGGDYSARVPVVSTDEAGALAQAFNRMAEGLAERETLREAFGAYVDPALTDRVLREGRELEAQELEVTVLFLDIREFTAFAESARPQDVMALLNEFWELVVPILLHWGGQANKFIGDGLLGVFGAPGELEHHAYAATSAALEIAERVEQRYAGTVNVGIGVNTGPVIAGTVGGGGRVEFTVIGDAVNTASRIEHVTRRTGDTVLITEATRQQLPEGVFAFDRRKPATLRGKRDPVRLWHPRRLPDPEPAPPVLVEASSGQGSG
jgi:class 3 adenylate cyclase